MLDDAACVGIRFENPTDVGTRCAPDPAAEPAPAPPAKCITFSCPDGYVTKESLPEGTFRIRIVFLPRQNHNNDHGQSNCDHTSITTRAGTSACTSTYTHAHSCTHTRHLLPSAAHSLAPRVMSRKNLSQSRLCALGSLVQILLILRLVVNPLQNASVSLAQSAI